MRATIDWDGVDWDSMKGAMAYYLKATRERYEIREVRVRSSSMDGLHVEVRFLRGNALRLRSEWHDDPVRLALDRVRSERAKNAERREWYRQGTLFNRKWLPSGDVLNAGEWAVVFHA